MNKSFVLLFSLLLGTLVAGCAVGPDYVRPASDVPADWNTNSEDARAIGTWWHDFGDPELVAHVEQSLVHNNDLKAAVARIDAAAATLRLARADYLPTINAGAGATRASASEAGVVPLPSDPYTEYNAGLLVNYEINVWGRVRRANEAALAELQRDIAVRDSVRATIAAAVAQAWFEARALDRRIALLDRLYATRLENLDLQKSRLDAGLIGTYDYEQARSETAAVAAQLPVLRSARLHALTALAVLRGDSPHAMFAAWSKQRASTDENLEALALPEVPRVPMDVPSNLLERRPDIRAAEQQLVAANARIGVAKAAYFPQLSLTGFAGAVSTAFSSLFESPTRTWEASVALTQPLTDFNRVGANVNAANAKHSAAEAAYARAIQAGFQETLDALANVTAAREVMQAQDERVDALGKAWRVAQARYGAGRIGYLEQLDVERQLRDVEQQQVTAKLSLLNATVDLYRALGGGWEEPAAVAMNE